WLVHARRSPTQAARRAECFRRPTVREAPTLKLCWVELSLLGDHSDRDMVHLHDRAISGSRCGLRAVDRTHYEIAVTFSWRFVACLVRSPQSAVVGLGPTSHHAELPLAAIGRRRRLRGSVAPRDE